MSFETHYDYSERMAEESELRRMAREAEDRHREYVSPEQMERERLVHEAKSLRSQVDYLNRQVMAAMQFAEDVAADPRTPDDYAWRLRKLTERYDHDEVELRRVPEPWLAARWPWRAITDLVGDKAEPVYWAVQKALCAFPKEAA